MRKILILFLLIFLAGCVQEKSEKIAKFSSEEEMKSYLIESGKRSYASPFFFGVRTEVIVRESLAIPTPVPTPMPIPTATPALEKAYDVRFSTTNVQVKGIDEPDIVKTDGENIYLSQITYFIPIRILPESKKVLPERGFTKAIKAYPPEEMEEKFELKEGGELLVANNTLIVLKRDEILAFDKNSGEKVWEMKLKWDYVTARLYDKLYIVTRSPVSVYRPCPIEIAEVNDEPLVVRCVDVYHPIEPVPAEVTYTIMKIDPESGEVVDKVSLLGSYGSVVYMSEKAIYVSYAKAKDPAEIMFEFVKANEDLFPKEVVERIEKLKSYDISNRAKSVEIQQIIDSYLYSLDRDERLKFEKEMWNRYEKFREEKKREFEKTEIVKISLELEPVAVGEVPGRLLNQFSMDEYEGYLRVATTFGDENDLYVLDEDLNVVGSITGFGKTERIYAVRFIADRGYIVTFRQIDPFFVIDLSNPRKPEIKGVLKIPGFSSYLHPITDHLILGIGKEGSYVKISLFDVSNAENPEEVDKFVLKEVWSEVLSNHHAFLLDSKHKVFFLPAEKNGYVFSYEGNELKLIKAVEAFAVRAIYIDDYLYIVGDKIVVFDENSWEKVKEFEFE
ncbi:Beta propeller domain protein [Ferroglobus placidus DSM 10642]|uniref:Beta propeller domain protein n=1 Tax=Ferroglobus placidus (strain DSM 10642 / AEDII12DO) TaxID=589924 RepID=D3RX83_FERPA|nr:beta-propeller domain-containing protein [Ferroglobus placidus]ADC65096.1 Beta propeller domain protein [Ferroglobus placidus DSM 10642]